MARYILGRLVATIPVLITVAVAVFLLIHLSPGDPAVVIAGEQASPADIEKIREKLGFNDPLLVQFMTWAGQMLTGDFGRLAKPSTDGPARAPGNRSDTTPAEPERDR